MGEIKTNRRAWRHGALCMAIGMGLAMSGTAVAANTDGSIVGRTKAGATVTVRDPSTGLTRTVTAGDDGTYRFPFLPVGHYRLESSKDGQAVAEPAEVNVSLGTATTVYLVERGSATTNLEGVQVSAPVVISAVDVSSTETATNISREEIRRLPVDQNVASVALLAPGVNKGNASFGGISFGGSSVAENSFYVNGLNVTDFYNRNGFSEAPFAFYQEFQVKTGGYSVEFGRTTGGVVNAVTRSGTNEFKTGAEMTFEPSAWQATTKNRYWNGERYITSSEDNYSRTKMNVYASGPIVKDKLFFFAMYEARGYTPQNTDNLGTVLTQNDTDSGFWGAKVDWHIDDKNLLEFMAFSDKNKNLGSVYNYDYDTHTKSARKDVITSNTGGRNWNGTFTSYLVDDLSMKLMYGRNEREDFTRAQSDIDCNPVARASAVPGPGVPLGCSTSTAVEKRNDTRKQGRADFEWTLGDHVVRFGYDHEVDTSIYSRRYPGPGSYYYNIYATTPGATIENGGVVPAGYNAYVRARRYEIAGTFETTNNAYYVEDNWNITPDFLLNAGLRRDAFDNKTGEGASYIKMDDMIAPRLGFSWDLKGDGTMKVFGNLGRYYLPVANVINIKQAGGLLDQRTYYAFDGYQMLDRNGSPYAMPILGPQIGPVDDSQGDGTVGDLRAEVDRHMDSVYQDEAILGFQQAITDTWSWGVSGTYRKLHNAIDDMEISATPQCGGDGYIGYVMGNPGRKLTVYGDTNCDGTPDGYIDIDTSKAGWALYDADGNYLGQRGWKKPRRTFGSLEFQVDRAWDEKWMFNASYVLSWSRGNAEGPVNSDTNFDDTGRTENFDDPWVNLSGGYLPNDHRHQFKLRGTYAITPQWQVGADLTALSGSPITGYGVGNPFDATVYHSYFICVDNCADPVSENRVYERSPRGDKRTPWTFNLNASITYLLPIDEKNNLRVKFAVYNLLNQQRTLGVDQDLQTSVGGLNPTYLQPQRFQSPRFGQLTVSIDF
ncbi:TonB-dependent Receptor Plug Domain [Luteibacter sp. UNC138MFCol5.1]|uniref:TonB-dependent receptor n=1 Tax=Luteibacter sp. UNC138MFCol5.1 TaxID=1502774 RepID=UPI0008B35563|nr:TonB-dependent receptor [Luteibacter sp. UNC138MFCol5.1]SEP10129.1 TonB-dependent Receptor Plug Domain [Luteibacter sp. UNC138MFCol5.1]